MKGEKGSADYEAVDKWVDDWITKFNNIYILKTTLGLLGKHSPLLILMSLAFNTSQCLNIHICLEVKKLEPKNGESKNNWTFWSCSQWL